MILVFGDHTEQTLGLISASVGSLLSWPVALCWRLSRATGVASPSWRIGIASLQPMNSCALRPTSPSRWQLAAAFFAEVLIHACHLLVVVFRVAHGVFGFLAVLGSP